MGGRGGVQLEPRWIHSRSLTDLEACRGHAPQEVIYVREGSQKTWSLPSRDLRDNKGKRIERVSTRIKPWSINFLK